MFAASAGVRHQHGQRDRASPRRQRQGHGVQQLEQAALERRRRAAGGTGPGGMLLGGDGDAIPDLRTLAAAPRSALAQLAKSRGHSNVDDLDRGDILVFLVEYREQTAKGGVIPRSPLQGLMPRSPSGREVQNTSLGFGNTDPKMALMRKRSSKAMLRRENEARRKEEEEEERKREEREEKRKEKERKDKEEAMGFAIAMGFDPSPPQPAAPPRPKQRPARAAVTPPLIGVEGRVISPGRRGRSRSPGQPPKSPPQPLAALLAALRRRGSDSHRDRGFEIMVEDDSGPSAPGCPSAGAATPGRRHSDDMPEDGLLRLSYVSRAVRAMPADELTALRRQAAARNAEDGVTGYLVYCQPRFFQSVEGPPRAVRALERRLRADPRHRDFTVCERAEARCRLFEGWSLELVAGGGGGDAAASPAAPGAGPDAEVALLVQRLMEHCCGRPVAERDTPPTAARGRDTPPAAGAASPATAGGSPSSPPQYRVTPPSTAPSSAAASPAGAASPPRAPLGRTPRIGAVKPPGAGAPGGGLGNPLTAPAGNLFTATRITPSIKSEMSEYADEYLEYVDGSEGDWSDDSRRGAMLDDDDAANHHSLKQAATQGFSMESMFSRQTDDFIRVVSEITGEAPNAHLLDMRKTMALDGRNWDLKFDELTPEDIETLEHAFGLFDTDNSGTLDFLELRILWCHVFGRGLDKFQLDNICGSLFEEIDTEQVDEISFAQLKNYLCGESDDKEDEEIMSIAGITGYVRVPRPCTWRQWLWAVMESPASDHYRHLCVRRTSLAVTLVINILIVVATINLIVSSVPGRKLEWMTVPVESFCNLCFTLEFVLRFIACPCSAPPERDSKILISQCQFWTRGFTWVDILAILPWWLGVAGMVGEGGTFVFMRIVRLVRVVRVLRMLKAGKRAAGVQLLMVAAYRSRMAVVWMCMLLLMGAVFYGSMMFFMEQAVDAELDEAGAVWMRDPSSSLEDRGQPLQFQSVLDGMWWAIGVLTTGGYGDKMPKTPAGYAICSMAMVSNLLLTAYPLTIICNTFADVWGQYTEWVARRQYREKLRAQITSIPTKSHRDVKTTTDGGGQPAPDRQATQLTDGARMKLKRRVTRLEAQAQAVRQMTSTVRLEDAHGAAEADIASASRAVAEALDNTFVSGMEMGLGRLEALPRDRLEALAAPDQGGLQGRGSNSLDSAAWLGVVRSRAASTDAASGSTAEIREDNTAKPVSTKGVEDSP